MKVLRLKTITLDVQMNAKISQKITHYNNLNDNDASHINNFI